MYNEHSFKIQFYFPFDTCLSSNGISFFLQQTRALNSILVSCLVFYCLCHYSASRLFVMFCLGCGKSNCKLNAQIFCPWMFTFSAICLRRCSRDLSLRVFCLPVHMWGPNAHVHASTSCVFSNPQPTTQHHNTHHQLAQTHTPTPSNTQYQYQYPIPTNMH